MEYNKCFLIHASKPLLQKLINRFMKLSRKSSYEFIHKKQEGVIKVTFWAGEIVQWLGYFPNMLPISV